MEVKDVDYSGNDLQEFTEEFGEDNIEFKEEIEKLISDGYDKEAIKGFIDDCGYDDLEYFEEAYQGRYKNDEDFTWQLLEDIGDLPKNLPGYIHIDMEATTSDIMMDYTETNGYYFRNI